MRKYIFLVLMAAMILVDAGTVAAKPLPFNLMPQGTELVSEQREDQTGFVIFKLKFRSSSSKTEILQFYRKMFINEGFQEVQGTPVPKTPEEYTFFFTRGNQMILVHLVTAREEGIITYFIHAHESGPLGTQ